MGRSSTSTPTRGFGVSARSMFTCSNDSGEALERRRSGLRRSAPGAGCSSASPAVSCSSGRPTVVSGSEELQQEDETLLALALMARAKVQTATELSPPLSPGWKERKDCPGVRVFEQRRDANVFSVAATTTLACSATEIMEVLSSRNSDHFNATMVALAGDSFSFGVTLREVPMSDADTHLTTKRVQFASTIPLVSSAKSLEFLDYVEVDSVSRTSVRTIQSLERDQNGRLTLAGDVLAGYVLQEHTAKQQTNVFFYGLHSAVDTGDVLQSRSPSLSDTVVQALLKLAKSVPKVGDIVQRRRFGAQDVLDPADYTSAAERATNCSACTKPLKDSLLRKKHFCYLCGHFTCSNCSKSQDVEGRIGVIERLRVCCVCVMDTRALAFSDSAECSHGSMDDGVASKDIMLLRASLCSSLSSTVMSSTTMASTTAPMASARSLCGAPLHLSQQPSAMQS